MVKLMNIGIDIDDTITNSTEIIKKYVIKYDTHYSNSKELINNLDNIVRGIKYTNIVERFFIDYCLEMMGKVKVKEHASEVINNLRKKDNKIFIITARSDKYYGDTTKYIQDYLKNNNIEYDEIIHSQTHKLKACKENKIDIMFDDAVDTCEILNKNKIKAYLFTSELNKDLQTTSPRVNDWYEIEKLFEEKM